MLKSWNFQSPIVIHAVQFTIVATVNGSGIDSADFVSITVASAASGDAKSITQKQTPIFPMSSDATSCRNAIDMNRTSKIIPETTRR
mmetsp:Transcript_12681/g.29121  ORF Transcript_12681/g.29121 Transcript_12681/m.29121 type:complete len:87 (-) Transcript_12681:531-791(-)